MNNKFVWEAGDLVFEKPTVGKRLKGRKALADEQALARAIEYMNAGRSRDELWIPGIRPMVPDSLRLGPDGKLQSREIRYDDEGNPYDDWQNVNEYAKQQLAKLPPTAGLPSPYKPSPYVANKLPSRPKDEYERWERVNDLSLKKEVVSGWKWEEINALGNWTAIDKENSSYVTAMRDVGMGRDKHPDNIACYRHFVSALKKCPKYKGILFRGILVENEQALHEKELTRVGSVGVFRSPCSWSKKKESSLIIASDLRNWEGELLVLMILTAKTGGADIDKITTPDYEASDEKEVISYPNLRFRVTDVGKKRFDKTEKVFILNISLEEI